MNTVKITKFNNGYRCEFHGSGLIPSEDYFERKTDQLLRDAAEWCARTPVALTHVAKPVPVEAGDGLLTPEQRRSLIDACNIPKEPLRVSGELPGGFKPAQHL